MIRRGRKSLHQILTEHNAADAFYAGLAGLPPRAQSVIAPPRAKRTRSASGKPLEKHILRAVIDALRAHPKVAIVWRMQSGLFQDGNRYIRVGSRGLPDVVGMLHGGRLFCIECKSETGRVTSEQISVLADVEKKGGIAGVARSVEDALEIIEQ